QFRVVDSSEAWASRKNQIYNNARCSNISSVPVTDGKAMESQILNQYILKDQDRPYYYGPAKIKQTTQPVAASTLSSGSMPPSSSRSTFSLINNESRTDQANSTFQRSPSSVKRYKVIDSRTSNPACLKTGNSMTFVLASGGPSNA